MCLASFRHISEATIDSSSCCYHGLATVKPPRSEAGTEALALTLTASGEDEALGAGGRERTGVIIGAEIVNLVKWLGPA